MTDPSIENINQNEEGLFDVDFQRILFYIRKNLRISIVIIILSLLAGYLLLRYTVPVYESSTTIQVTVTNTAQNILELEKTFENPDISVAAEILSSPFLFQRALKRLPLNVSYYNKGRLLSHELYKNTPFTVTVHALDSNFFDKQFFIHFENERKATIKCPELGITETTFDLPEFKTRGIYFKFEIPDFDIIKNNFQSGINDHEFIFVVNSMTVLTEKLIKNLSVSVINPQANTIKISFRDNNASKAADIANAIAEEFKIYDLENRSQSSRQVLKFLEEQLSIAYSKLKESENLIREFKKENKISETYQLNSNYLEQLRRLEDDLINTNYKLTVLNELQNKMNLIKNDQEVTQLLALISGDIDLSQALSGYVESLKNLYFTKQKLLTEASENNQAVQNINNQIQLQKNLIFETIKAQINLFLNRKKEIAGKIKDLEGLFSDIPEKEIEYARLQRVYTIDEKFFNLLLEKKTEFSIAEAGFVPQHLILDVAKPSKVPVYPNKKVILFGFFLAGILLSIIIIALQFVFDNKIHSLQELEKILNYQIPVLGAIPKYKRKIPVSQLVIDNNPKSLMAESFRNIRSNLQFIDNSKGAKIISITSTISGEGKTFVAINLAAIFAYSDKKVVILDLDMRKPKIHIGFGVENSQGMSNLLIGNGNLNDCIRSSQMENLFFITSGATPPNPAELIINGNLEKIIEELKQSFDYIIIDNPPIGLVSDALLPLQIANYPVYVMRSGYSKKFFAEHIIKLYRDYKIKKVSVVLNGIDLQQNKYGYYYGYGYGNYSTYYIDDTQEKQNGFFAKILGK